MSINKGKIAIVTGATGGIGFEVAKRLGKDGFTIILNGILLYPKRNFPFFLLDRNYIYPG